MNKKGFTLVELLAVIVILGAVSSIAVLGIRSSLVNRESRELDEQKELAMNAAKIYFSLNAKDSQGRVVKTSNGVFIKTLKKRGYFNATSKTDKLGDDDCVKVTSAGAYKYYQYSADSNPCTNAHDKND